MVAFTFLQRFYYQEIIKTRTTLIIKRLMLFRLALGPPNRYTEPFSCDVSWQNTLLS